MKMMKLKTAIVANGHAGRPQERGHRESVSDFAGRSRRDSQSRAKRRALGLRIVLEILREKNQARR